MILSIKQFLSLLLLTIFSATALAQTPTADQELANLLSGFQSMSATFQQVASGGKGNPAQTSSGKMALQRPGKFRWEVKQPNPQLLIADGRYLWIYDPDLEQATRQSLDSSNANSPASLLSGSIASLQDRFQVTRLPSGGFRLKPKSGNDIFQWIELYFNSGRLIKMVMRDNLGSLNTFSFTAAQINPNLADNLFHFKAPKGVEVIKN